MRGHHAGVAARLLLVLALLAGSVITAIGPSGVSTGSVPGVAASKSQGKTRSDDRDKKAKPKPKKRDGDKKKAKSKDKDGKKSKQERRADRVPAALDAERIAAENADTVAAFECGDLIEIRVGDRVYCTHGEDPTPPGPPADEGVVAIESVADTGPLPGALCLDDGVSGPRIQIVYVHRNDRSNRLGEMTTSFRRWAAEMDTIFDQSAGKTGGSLRLRFVTNANCQVEIARLVVPPRALDGFGSLIQKMHEAGFDRLDRKYLMLVDERIYCGVGTFLGNDSADDPGTQAHNFTGYARVDIPCWDAGSMAHELSHTMGGVQYSAPHTSRGGHCIDEWDVMCYTDEPFKPKMQFLCSEGSQDFRLDCGNDDYFAARPAPGSYLASHWNMADSPYLTLGNGPTCVDAALEPDDAYWYDFWKAPMRHFPLGTSEARAFCDQSGDTDWFLFRVRGGASYTIETTDLGPDVDTRLVLYRGFEEQRWEGMDEVATNDNRAGGDLSSQITFTAPSDSSYLVGVSEALERAGLDKTYSISIREVPTTGTGVVSLSRGKAKPGASFTVTMHSLTPGAAVTFWSQRGGQVERLGDATAGSDGNAVGRYKLPRSIRKGIVNIEGTASDTSAGTAALKVVPSGNDANDKNKSKSKSKKKQGSKHKHKQKKRGRGKR